MKQLHIVDLKTGLRGKVVYKKFNMKGAIRYKLLLIISVFITLTSLAQDFEDKQNTNATLIKINEHSDNEEKPVPCFITYSDYTKKLEVKRAMPLTSQQAGISDSSADSNLFKFDLVFDLDRDKMQENVASGKVFSTYGVFTFNNYTRNVLVQYSSLPAHVNSPGDFYISFMVSITPQDFEITDKNSEWILRINDAAINLTDD